jgi:hypothetical protein
MGQIDRTKLAKLDGLIQDLLDEIEDAGEDDVAAEALFEPLSQASAALHAVLTTYAVLTMPPANG